MTYFSRSTVIRTLTRRVIHNNTLRRDDNKVNKAEARICGVKGGNATMGIMVLMDARLLERHAIIINYHRYCISDSALAVTGILLLSFKNCAPLEYLFEYYDNKRK